jgi:cystathionine beta-lyase
MHPALPGDPGHALWQRDFIGACGLFGVKLAAGVPVVAMEAMIDALQLFGLGTSWGGFESLVLPTELPGARTATRWVPPGPVFRMHAGLEAVDDLIADLALGFSALRAAMPR